MKRDSWHGNVLGMGFFVSFLASIFGGASSLGAAASSAPAPVAQSGRSLEERILHIKSLQEGIDIAADLRKLKTVTPFFEAVEKAQGHSREWRLAGWMLDFSLPVIELCGEIGSAQERKISAGWISANNSYMGGTLEHIRWSARGFVALIPEADFKKFEDGIDHTLDIYAKEDPHFGSDTDRENYARDYQTFEVFRKEELPRWQKEVQHRREVLGLKDEKRKEALEAMAKSPTGPMPEATARWATARLQK